MTREVIYTSSFVESAADRILYYMQRGLAEEKVFSLSLCGGSTPFPVYEEIARKGKSLPWGRVIITFGDERCVPPDHKDSNYRAAKAAFLDKIPLPVENVLRMKGELSPDAAAADYEDQLSQSAAKHGLNSFNHSLILLGMGDDGHTASLFPGTDAVEVNDRRVVCNYVPKMSAHRITLTLPFINASDVIMFLVNDSRKRQIIEAVLDGATEYPAARVRPEHGALIWMLGGLR